MAAIKQLVNSLHSSLGIAEFQYQHHSRLKARKNEILDQLAKLTVIKEAIDKGECQVSAHIPISIIQMRLNMVNIVIMGLCSEWLLFGESWLG